MVKNNGGIIWDRFEAWMELDSKTSVQTCQSPMGVSGLLPDLGFHLHIRNSFKFRVS